MNKPLTPQQQKLFAAWCALAMQKMPYMAPTLYLLRPVSTRSTTYAAVDNKGRLYLNFDNIEAKRDVNFGAEALLHECSHVLADHFTLATSVPGALGTEEWLKAADLAINDDLDAAGCSTIARYGIVPASFQLPEWQTPIWYFDKLRQDSQQQRQQSGGGDSGQGDPSQQSGDGSGADDPSQQGGCGSGSGGPSLPDELGDDDLDGAAPAATITEVNLARESTATRIVEHSKSRGNVPAGLLRQAEDLLAPAPIPWKRMLASRMRATVLRWREGASEDDWSKRSRRHAGATIARPGGPARVFMPARREPVPSVACVVDTSGSMSPADLGEVLGQVEAISRQLGVRGRSLQMLFVDADVHAVAPFHGRVGLSEVLGGGGTDMRVGVEAVWAMPRRLRPTVCVVLTDGYTPWPAAPGPVPVIAAVLCPQDNPGRASQGVPPWIRVVPVSLGG